MNKIVDSVGLSWASMFIFALKLLLIVTLVVGVSWGVAVLWSSHGDGWRRLLPDFMKRIIHSLLKGILSTDLAEAEDQLDFSFFWLPSLLVTIAIVGLGYCMRRHFVMR